eukprot:3940776-Rhodomonas_salina.1
MQSQGRELSVRVWRTLDITKLWDHEKECDLADSYKRMTGPKALLRAWDEEVLRAAKTLFVADGEGSDCDDMRD